MERTLREQIAALGDEKHRPFLIYTITFSTLVCGLQSLNPSAEEWRRLVVVVAVAGSFTFILTMLLIKKFAPEKAKDRLHYAFLIFIVLISSHLSSLDLSVYELLKFALVSTLVGYIVYFMALALIKWARRTSAQVSQ